MSAPQILAADALRELHSGDALVIVPNAWDVASARTIATAGARTVATTSGGVAFAAGYPDGQRLPFATMLARLREIAGGVGVPVSADIEGGYLHETGGARNTAEQLVGAGVAGVNLEDGAFAGDGAGPLVDAETHAERVAEAKSTGIWVNARTDVFWRGVGPAEERVEETIRRLRLYQAAGADALYAPLLNEPDEIKTVAASVSAPLNVLWLPGMPSLDELEAIGVRRVTFGWQLQGAALALTESISRALLARDTAPLAQAPDLSAAAAGAVTGA